MLQLSILRHPVKSDMWGKLIVLYQYPVLCNTPMSRALEKSRKLWRTDKSVLFETRNVSCQSVFHTRITSQSYCRASLAICHLHLYSLIKGNIITDNQIFLYDILFSAWEGDACTHTQHISSQVPCVEAFPGASDWRSCQNALDES